MMFLLTNEDVSDILYDLEEASIFFSEPIRVKFPRYPMMSVGSGLGGFSWTLFNRGASCNCCGNCCKRTFRRIWFWWDTEENRPIDLEPLEIRINDSRVNLWVHLNKSGIERCDFLVDDIRSHLVTPGDKFSISVAEVIGYCSLHKPKNIKPAHCHLHPQTGVYKTRTGRGTRSLLSRRLPSRNWRWPKCPIDIASVPYAMKDFLDDSYSLQRMTDAIRYVPGSHSGALYRVWKDLSTNALSNRSTQENIFFEDL